MKKQPVTYTELECSTCRMTMPIPRKVSKRRKTGHIKHMYCTTCQEVTAFEEGNTKDTTIIFWQNWQQQHT